MGNVSPGAPREELVWHYTDGAGLVSIVRNHVLWATASGYLDDRDEVTLGYRRLEAELDSRAGSGDEFARRMLDMARSSGGWDTGSAGRWAKRN